MTYRIGVGELLGDVATRHCQDSIEELVSLNPGLANGLVDGMEIEVPSTWFLGSAAAPVIDFIKDEIALAKKAASLCAEAMNATDIEVRADLKAKANGLGYPCGSPNPFSEIVLAKKAASMCAEAASNVNAGTWKADDLKAKANGLGYPCGSPSPVNAGITDALFLNIASSLWQSANGTDPGSKAGHIKSLVRARNALGSAVTFWQNVVVPLGIDGGPLHINNTVFESIPWLDVQWGEIPWGKFDGKWGAVDWSKVDGALSTLPAQQAFVFAGLETAPFAWDGWKGVPWLAVPWAMVPWRKIPWGKIKWSQVHLGGTPAQNAQAIIDAVSGKDPLTVPGTKEWCGKYTALVTDADAKAAVDPAVGWTATAQNYRNMMTKAGCSLPPPSNLPTVTDVISLATKDRTPQGAVDWVFDQLKTKTGPEFDVYQKAFGQMSAKLAAVKAAGNVIVVGPDHHGKGFMPADDGKSRDTPGTKEWCDKQAALAEKSTGAHRAHYLSLIEKNGCFVAKGFIPSGGEQNKGAPNLDDLVKQAIEEGKKAAHDAADQAKAAAQWLADQLKDQTDAIKADAAAKLAAKQTLAKETTPAEDKSTPTSTYVTGTAASTIIGAAIGYAVRGKQGALIGAGVGAAAGVATSLVMSSKEKAATDAKTNTTAGLLVSPRGLR